MALTADFKRFAYDHGDLGVWLPLMERFIAAGGLGGLSIEASNVVGVLTVSQGFGGIYDGTLAGKGAIQVTTAGSVSTAAGTAGLWHALEYSVSGTSVTWYLTSLAGETDESFMSLTMKGYYDGSKAGYYRIASRRVVAFVFLRAALALGRIVNCENGKLGFKGIRTFINGDAILTAKYITSIEMTGAAWNMDTTQLVYLTLPFNVSLTKIKSQKAYILSNVGAWSDLPFPNTASCLVQGYSYLDYSMGYRIYFARLTGGSYDQPNWNNASYGGMIEFET